MINGISSDGKTSIGTTDLVSIRVSNQSARDNRWVKNEAKVECALNMTKTLNGKKMINNQSMGEI